MVWVLNGFSRPTEGLSHTGTIGRWGKLQEVRTNGKSPRAPALEKSS